MRRTVAVTALLACLGLFVLQAEAASDGTLRVGVGTDWMSPEPVGGGFTGTGQMMQRHMVESLCEIDTKGNLQPALATSWKLVDDRTWQFNLRRGVKFHDGSPFTAADVKFSIEYLMDPANQWNYRSLFEGFAGVEILDDYTINLKTKEPDPVLAKRWAVRVRTFSKKFFDENGPEGLRKRVVGTGPFKFVEWKRNDSLVMEANTEHYQSPPKIKRLLFRIIPEMGARVAEFQSGGLDVISEIPPFMVPQLKSMPNAEIQVVPSTRAMYFLLDTTSIEALKDKRVRQALNYAVDKEGIIKGMLNGLGKPLGINAPMTVAGYNDAIKPYPWDPEKARSLLKEAGFEKDLVLDIYSPNARYPMDKEVVIAVADQLSKVGIKTNVHVMETNTYIRGVSRHEFKGVFLMGMATGESDIDYTLSNLQSKFVLCFYPSPKLDEMVRQAKATMDEGKRFALAKEIQQLVHDEAAYLFLYNESRAYGVSKRVRGFEAPPNEMMEFWKVSLVE